jgi:hypothetical protein
MEYRGLALSRGASGVIFLASPRLRGEVAALFWWRVRETRRELRSSREPLTLTLSPRRAGRGRSQSP